MAATDLVPDVHQSLKRAEQSLVRPHGDQHIVQGARLTAHHLPEEFSQDGDQGGVALCKIYSIHKIRNYGHIPISSL